MLSRALNPIWNFVGFVTSPLLYIALFQRAPRTAFRATLQEAGIVPGASPLTPVVDSVCAGSPVTLEVAFGARRLARDGEVLAPGQAAETPTVKIQGGTPGKLYVLANVDPDAPDPANPIRGEWLHYLVKDVPASGTAADGFELTSWRGPAPPIGTHRYIFLLYEQPGALGATDPTAGDMSKRAGFKIKTWAAEQGLGDPVAVAWFNSHK